MKKVFVLLLMLFLAACGGAAPESPTAVSQAGDGPDAAPVETAVDSPAEPITAAVESAGEPALYDAATTVAEAAVLRPSDWVKGAAEPSVVIIEYGDFQ